MTWKVARDNHGKTAYLWNFENLIVKIKMSKTSFNIVLCENSLLFMVMFIFPESGRLQ